MAKPPSSIATVQDFLATLPAARDLKTGSFFAAELGHARKAAKPGQVWFITTVGRRNRSVTVKKIATDEAFMHFRTQAAAIEATRNEEITAAIPVLDAFQTAFESLLHHAAAYSDAVERRGDEIDDLLAQIRANMSASQAV